jgi:hypothetical protein
MYYGLYLHPLVKRASRIVSEDPTPKKFKFKLIVWFPADCPLLYLILHYCPMPSLAIVMVMIDRGRSRFSFRSFQQTVKYSIVSSYLSGTGNVPAPFSTKELINNNINDGGNNQNEILFNRGNRNPPLKKNLN